MVNRKAGTLLAIASLLVAFVGARSQELDSAIVGREAIVHFLRGVISLPQGSDSATLQDVTITVPAVETTLAAFSAEMITKAYPGCDTVDSMMISREGEAIRIPDRRGIYLIRFPESTDMGNVVVALESLPSVPYAGQNGWVTLFGEPNDTYFHPASPPSPWADQWNLRYDNNIGSNWIAAWNMLSSIPPPWPTTVKIALFDEGVHTEHPDLSGQVEEHGLPNGPHGTMVAGILAP